MTKETINLITPEVHMNGSINYKKNNREFVLSEKYVDSETQQSKVLSTAGTAKKYFSDEFKKTLAERKATSEKYYQYGI